MSKEFRLIVAGSREFAEYATLEAWLDRLLSKKVEDGFKIIIICGGAKGADAAGKRYAECRGYNIEMFIPQWQVRNPSGELVVDRRAGMRRNEDMGRLADAAAIAWDSQSSGSAHMMKFMLKLKKPTRVWEYLTGKVTNYF